VVQQTGRTRATVLEYLCEFVREEQPASIRPWLADETYQRVAQAVAKVGSQRLKPIYIELGEQVPYDEIRLVVAHLVSTEP
jgi:hypothetical protein